MLIRRHGSRAITVIAAAILCLAAVFPSAAATSGTRPNVDIIYDYLISDMYLNSAAACGVLANIEAESGFRSDIYGDGGTSYGICQWHDYKDAEGNYTGRFTNLKNYCDANGLEWQTVEGQLAFLKYELTSSSWYAKTWNYLHSVPNTDQGAYDAAYYWCYNFEIPAQKEIQSERRGENARNKYWPIYGNGEYEDGKPFEMWRVGSQNLNVRTGPDTTYPVSTTLTPGTDVRVTEITQSGNSVWAKSALGWSVLAGLEYVSGELYTVTYRTNCTTGAPSVKVRYGGTVTLDATSSLVKFGHVFKGWEIAGTVLRRGTTLSVTGNVTAIGVWTRDTSVALISGDSNCDGKVNAKDVTALMKHLIGADNGVVEEASDVNGDTKVNGKDVIALMKKLVGA